MKFGTFRQLFFAAAVWLAALIFPSFIFAATQGLKDAVVIYGGVGNLSRNAQPCLAALYESNNKKFLPYTDKINGLIQNTLSKTSLPFAKGPVIVSSEQLNGAMKAEGVEFSGRPTQTQIKEFLEDHVHLL